MEAKSITVSARSGGSVTISTQGATSPAGQPIVQACLTVGLMGYPVQMSLDDARKLARNLIDAANNAQQLADGVRQMARVVSGA